MKYLIFSFFFTLVSITNSYAIICEDIPTVITDQTKRLESSKIRVFEQENINTKLIQELKVTKINSIKDETDQRIMEIKSIVDEIENISKPSKGIKYSSSLIRSAITQYSTTTKSTIESFNASVDTILDDREKSIRTIVEQYTFDTLKVYNDASYDCSQDSFKEDEIDAKIRTIRKKALDSQENTRRMTQGIDASYAKLTLDLNALDEELKDVLKSVRPIIKKEFKTKEAPLSFRHLFQM